MNKVKIEVKKIIISEVLLAEVCYLEMKLVCEECKSKINAYKPSTYFHKKKLSEQVALENIRSERATEGRKYKETFSVDTFSSFCPPA